MSKNTTITDIPRTGASDADKFGLSAYEKGLEQFLRGAETPITIALQGEWGSGRCHGDRQTTSIPSVTV